MAPECGKPTGSKEELQPTGVLGLLLSQDNFREENVNKNDFGEYTDDELEEFGIDPRSYEFVGDSDIKTCTQTNEELGVMNDGNKDQIEEEVEVEEVVDPTIVEPVVVDPTIIPEIEEDDEIVAKILGCMTPGKENYNPLATEDDGSCISIKGCMTVGNPNYNDAAEVHDENQCTEEADPDAGVIVGCMNSDMDNYDSTATEELSETIPLAGGGTISKSCLRTGCRDKKALNFDPIATADYTHKECTYKEEVIDETETIANGICPKLTDIGGFNSKMPTSFTKFEKASGASRGKAWDKLEYCCVDDDGSDGNMKWKWVWNKRGKKFYVPKPTTFSVAKKYWRDNILSSKCGINYKKDNKLSIKNTGNSGQHCSAELCCVHWTAGHSKKTYDALYSVWGHLKSEGRNWSVFGYNWVILGGKNDGKVQQVGPEKPNNGQYYDGRVNGVGTWNARALNINHVGGALCNSRKELKSYKDKNGDWQKKRVGIVKGYHVESGKYRPSYGLNETPAATGKPSNMPSKKQMNTLMDMVDAYHQRYPKMKFFGHHQASNKECPGYNFGIFLDTIGNGYEKLAFRAKVGGGGGSGKGDDLWSTPTKTANGEYNKVLYRNATALTDQSPVDETGTGDIYYNSNSLKKSYGVGTVYEKRAWAYASLFKGRKPPGGQCFYPGTKIAMANSRSKNIENIKVGDLIKAYNTDTNKIIKATVTDKFYSKNTGDYYIINNDLKVTGNHPFWVNNKWKEVKKLKIGDELLNLDGSKIAIKSIELKYDDDGFVHNFEVDKFQNYFAGSYLVHNKPPFPMPDSNDNSNDNSNGNTSTSNTSSSTEEDGNTDTETPPWKEMDCDEFTVFVKDLNKKHVLRGYMAGLEKDDRDDFKEKAYTCS